MDRVQGPTNKLPPDAESAPPKTRAEAVYRQFRQDILWGVLAPGAPLRSDELRRSYDIGISPLREALSRLASERLVISTGQRGFRVAPITVEDILDTMETRIVLECEALMRSIQSDNLEWEAGVVSAFHALSRLDMPEEPERTAEQWANYHRKFHMALLAGCGSTWMMTLAGSLFDHAERHRLIAIRTLSREEIRDTAASEHARIKDAALSGNVKAAVAALDHHYRTTAELVAAIIAEKDDKDE